jgi:hypothetical protein
MDLLWEQFGASWWIYAQLAFTIAMLMHVYRSGAEQYWFFIILFLQPIGAWAYLFVILLPGLRFSSGGSSEPWFQRRLSLAELRYRAERTPTVNNRIAYAEGLMANGEHSEAIALLEAVIATDQIHCQAMHDLALCHLACKEPAKAIAMIKRLHERDYRWSNYRAWRTLIEAHVANNDAPGALKACRELEKMVPTLENKCLLAEHMLDNKLNTEAIQMLDQALEDHSFLPWNKRFKNWHWARYAKKLLNEAESS